MLLLTGTSDLVRVVTDAAGDIEVHASWADNAAGVITPGRTNTASITTATTTTVVGSPASSEQRNVRHLNIRNNHGSQAVLVTVFHTDGTTQEDLFECTLLAGEALVFDERGKWTHYEADGDPYPKSTANVATQAEMETATDVVRNVTPGRQHFHPGHPKVWITSPSHQTWNGYNITSITLAAGLLTVNIATDFASADWCCQVSCARSATSLTVTNLKMTNIRFNTQTAGQVVVEVYDRTATNAVQEHPEAYHMVGYGDFA